jgi:hypothetical protein
MGEYSLTKFKCKNWMVIWDRQFLVVGIHEEIFNWGEGVKVCNLKHNLCATGEEDDDILVKYRNII